jgi:Mg-chelatase subunit ChlD
MTTNTSQKEPAANLYLKLTFTTEYEEATLREQEFYAMLSITAPKTVAKDEPETRAPVDIVCVIDKSGSMKGEKIELMKKTLLFMVEQLNGMDRISLVLFDSSVDTALPLTAMDQDGKKKAKKIIQEVRVGTCTNLSGGLLEGLDVMKRRETTNEVSSLLLFTDGLANEGLKKSSGIVTAARKKIEDIGKTISVFTFGFGADHDANMLRSISEIGNGLYYFLETTDAIPSTFSDCLGGLTSVSAQNIKLRIQTLENGVEIGTIHSTYNKKEMDPKNNIELFIGDIYIEESKNIVFTIKLPQVPSPIQSQGLLRATLNYFDVIQMTDKCIETQVFIKRVEQMPPNAIPNKILDKQRNRSYATKALESGRELANMCKLEEARKVLEDSIEAILTSTTSDDQYCQGLILDLRECLADMSDTRSYKSQGSKKINTYFMSNAQERTTSFSNPIQSRNQTSRKAAIRLASSDFVSNK